MGKGLPQLQLINGRWRGLMPFRASNRKQRKPLDLERRTGEPSPSTPIWHYPEGYGKANGSYTEKMRLALREWMNYKYGTQLAPLVFEYKLSRHSIITIIGIMPYIKHAPSWGKGKRGLILELYIQSIDGIPTKMLLGNRVTLVWNRIIGKEKLFALPEPKKEVT